MYAVFPTEKSLNQAENSTHATPIHGAKLSSYHKMSKATPSANQSQCQSQSQACIAKNTILFPQYLAIQNVPQNFTALEVSPHHWISTCRFIQNIAAWSRISSYISYIIIIPQIAKSLPLKFFHQRPFPTKIKHTKYLCNVCRHIPILVTKVCQ